MHLEAMIVRTWKPESSEFGDALGGREGANLQDIIERVERYTWRLCSSDIGDALGGHIQTRLEEY